MSKVRFFYYGEEKVRTSLAKILYMSNSAPALIGKALYKRAYSANKLTLILSFQDPKEKIESWRDEYNTFLRNNSLADLTPKGFLE